MSIEASTISIDRSLDAAQLRALAEQWSHARSSSATADELRAIERGFEAHRAKLFVENASLQADGDGSEQTSSRIESNQLAIKASTVALAELREAISGR
ncbi:MAG: hypothetical protein U0269_27645 [Polyangiales bacterium]